MAVQSAFRRLAALLLLLTAAVLLTACGGGETGATEGGGRYVIVSGGQSGVYYPTAGAIARLARRAEPGLNLDVQTSGGSTANARLLHHGDAQFALMQNNIAAYARAGEAMFADGEPMTTIQGVAALYPEHIQIVARADAGIESIEDLAGRTVAIGDIGSGTEADARNIFEAHGMSVDDLGTVERLGGQEAADYVQDGHIDAAFYTFGVGTSSIQTLAEAADIVFVPVTGDGRDALMQRYPFYSEAVIPAGAYGEGVPRADVPTVSVMATLVARADVPAAVVENVLRGIFANVEDFHRAHRRLREVNRADAQAKLSLPMHEGARAFYGEGEDAVEANASP
ncbi:MAG: TAXI family TRAP transporter solute-binding subunit [Phycisphaeraceae bacterium]